MSINKQEQLLSACTVAVLAHSNSSGVQMKSTRFKESCWKTEPALWAGFWKPKELLLELAAAHVNKRQQAWTISQAAKYKPNGFQLHWYFLNLFGLGKVTPVCQKGSVKR